MPKKPKPYQPNDKWSQRAAEEGFRARSVYKLMELDQRMHLLTPGMTVLDLGAAPGSWLQYASQQIGTRGKAIGLDLTEIKPVADNVSLYVQDITDHAAIDAILQQENLQRVDIVLSDVAPNTSGIRDVDQWRSVELAMAVMETAKRYLKPGGKVVTKIFRGADFDKFLAEVRKSWEQVRLTTVKASRESSREIYVTAKKPKASGMVSEELMPE